MDPFDKKREMVHQLLSMLKKHASDEVDSGLKRPEGEGDMHGIQDEKVEDLPNHKMDESTPEHEVDTKLVPEGHSTANLGYSKGGVVEDVNAEKYSREGNTAIPYESSEGHPDLKAPLQEDAAEPLDEREASIPQEEGSLFDNFLRPLKKRKSSIK